MLDLNQKAKKQRDLERRLQLSTKGNEYKREVMCVLQNNVVGVGRKPRTVLQSPPSSLGMSPPSSLGISAFWGLSPWLGFLESPWASWPK